MEKNYLVVNQLTYDFNKFAGEQNSGELIVEPEKCLTIREIAEQFASGYDITPLKGNLDEGLEYNDDDIDNIPNPQYDTEFDDIADYLRRSEQSEERSEERSEEKSEKQPNTDEKVEEH